MILVFGGTSDTPPVVAALAEAGLEVLVSVATEHGAGAEVLGAARCRAGRLGLASLEKLIGAERIEAVVDTSHPYATLLKSTAAEACKNLSVPLFSYVRPSTLHLAGDLANIAGDHETAARISCSLARSVLLTTGSNNLKPYASEAKATGVALAVRVLPSSSSLQACRDAGIPLSRVLQARGPFGVEENIQAIRRVGAGCLVSKESGTAGGFPEKVEAARRTGCALVVVRRPHLRLEGRQAYDAPEKLAAAVCDAVTTGLRPAATGAA